MIRLRPAESSDAAEIRRIIRQAQINPTGLDWRRFTLAVNEQDEIVGCGQLKPHRDGSIELASIAVTPNNQGQGIARLLIEHLLAKQPPPLYLMCRPELQPFYEKFGFQPAADEELPAYFQRIQRLVNRVRRVIKNAPGPLIMKLNRS